MIKQKDVKILNTEIIFSGTKTKMGLYQFLNDCKSHQPFLETYRSKPITIKLLSPIPPLTEKALLKLLQKFNIKPKISKQLSIQIIKNLSTEIGVGIASLLLLITYYQNSLITKKTMALENLKIQTEQNTLIKSKKNQIHNIQLANMLPLIFKIPLTVVTIELDEKKLNLHGIPFDQSSPNEWKEQLPNKKIFVRKLQKNNLKITLENIQ